MLLPVQDVTHAVTQVGVILEIQGVQHVPGGPGVHFKRIIGVTPGVFRISAINA